VFGPILLVYPHINLLLNKRYKDEAKQKTKKLSVLFKVSEESHTSHTIQVDLQCHSILYQPLHQAKLETQPPNLFRKQTNEFQA
jgi:hypothetical protein